jgi:hypothetical protein
MLTFRNTNIFFFLLLLFIVLVHVMTGVTLIVYPVLLVAYSLVVFYGCYFVDSSFFFTRNLCRRYNTQGNCDKF